MIKKFGNYVYEYFPGYQAAYGGLSARLDVWNADEKGKRSTWVGCLIRHELLHDGAVREVGNVPSIMRKFCKDLMEVKS